MTVQSMVRALILPLSCCGFSLHGAEPARFPLDPLLGSWHLNLDKTQLRGREPPQSQTIVYEPLEKGISARIVTVDSDGEESEIRYVVTGDGIPSPLYGFQEADEITLRRQDPFVSEATLRHGDSVVGTVERRISPDGMEMTLQVSVRNYVIGTYVYGKALNAEAPEDAP